MLKSPWKSIVRTHLLGFLDIVGILVQDLINVSTKPLNAGTIDKDVGIIQVLDNELAILIQAQDDLLDRGITI